MALLRKLFYRKPPDGLLEICERVYVFDCCFTLDSLEEQNYKGYVGSIISQLKEHYPDATLLAFNFREGEVQSQIANALTEYDMTIMEYPRQYEGCPLLPMEVIHHFLRSSESWLQLGLQNLLLMHCEPGGWPVLAFMLAALLIYRKHYTGELKTLDMVYRQAPRELLQLLSPLNPIPSQLRYLQYVSRRNVATEWPPLDRALTMDCIIIRMIPNFDGGGGCRPIFRIYGQDPLLVSDRAPKILFSTPKKSRAVRHYKQAECELVKIDINCHIQGDVVLECICLHGDMEREEMMFRTMFNTAFIRSNILMLNRDDIDILWDAKDQFPKDFRAEVLFSEMDTAVSVAPADYSCFEEKDGLPVEAFAKVQEMFSSVDWLVPKGDGSSDVLHHLHVPNTVNETDSHADKSPANQSPAASEAKYIAGSTAGLSSINASSNMSPNADVGRMQNDPTEVGEVKTTKQILVPPPSSHLPTITKVDHISPKQQSMSNVQGSDTAKCFSPLREADTPKQQPKSSAQESDMCKSSSPLGEADKSSSKTFVSTPSNQSSSKDAEVDRGKPLFSPKSPILEDNIGIQSPGASTSSSKEDTTTRTSSTSRESPMTHDEVKDGPPKSEPPRATTSTDDANFPRPPLLSPPTHSSSVLGVGKSSGGESTSSRPSSSKTEVTPKPAPGGSPSHLSSLETEVAVKDASGETVTRDPSLPKTNATIKPPSPHLPLSKTDVAPKTAPGGPPSPHLSSLKTEVTSETVPPESTRKTDVARKAAPSGPHSPHLSSLKAEVTHTTASGETATRDPYLPKTDVTSKTPSSKSSSPHLSLSKTDVMPKTGPSEPSSHTSKDVPPNITHGGPPAPHLSSLKTEVQSETAGEPASPHTSPPKTNVSPKTKSGGQEFPHPLLLKKGITPKIPPPIKEKSSTAYGPTSATPSSPPRPPPISTSTDNSAGPPSPDASPLSPHLRRCSPKKRPFPPPEASNENLFFKERLLLKPPRPAALDSPSKKQSSSGVAPVPPTPPAIDNTITRPTPSPLPPARDNTVTRPAPSPPPPPPPPVPAKESSSEGWPPQPPSPPSSHQNAGSEKATTSSPPCPPPPPTAPAALPPLPTAPAAPTPPPAAPPPPSSAPAAPPPPPSAPSVPSAPPPPASPAVPSAPPPPGASSVPLAPPIRSSRGSTLPGAPSPPPLSAPAPPPGAKGKSLFSRNAASKNNQKKLKPLHWLKLTRAVTGSLWAEAQKSGEATKAPEIDISELESLFSAAVPNAGQGGSSRKGASRAAVGNKPEKVQLIDHRRAYNCEIMLSKVKIPLHDVLTSVLALEDSVLDADQVDNLIKFCPTKDEMEVLKGYKGERDKLGKCEQFFMELMQVPRIEYKLRVFSFKIQFCSQVSDLRNSLNVVNSAADQIRGSAKLKRIMQTILSLGNALNQGTARGSAVGFRLDSLLKLTETRARNNKMTLMHYLCKVLSDKLPELLDFWQELSSLEPSAKIQLKFLAEEMQAINKGLEKVVQELSMSESDGPVSDQFRKALKEFLGFSEGEVRSLASLYAGVGRNVDSLILYFGEDPSRCPFEQVISTLLNFVKMFKKCHDENCKQQEFERKKAEKEKEKEASEKLKMNGSDTAGRLLQPSPVK